MIVRPLSERNKPQSTADRQAILAPDGKTIRIFFNQDAPIVEVVKRIYDRKCIDKGVRQVWEAPATLDALEKLREKSFTLDQNLQDWEGGLFARPPATNPNLIIPGLRHKLVPFQNEGVQVIDWRNGRLLLADDQGLGKTVQVLAWLQWRKRFPAVVICPANLKINWGDEVMFWMTDVRPQVIYGTDRADMTGDIIIINYDILTQIKNGKNVIRPDLWNFPYETFIADEAHYASNMETIRGWAVQQLAGQAEHVIPVSATPGKNRPAEIFALGHMVDKRVFPSWFKYAHRYCGPTQGYRGNWEFKGSSNEEELHHKLSRTIMLRRKKRDVFPDLPKKVRIVLPLPLSNEREYRQADTDFGKWMKINRPDKQQAAVRSQGFYKLQVLQELAVQGKIDAAVDWVRNMLLTEDKLVIFAEHKVVIDRLMEEFPDIAVRVDGTVGDVERDQAKHAFQRCRRCGVKKDKHDFDDRACAEYVPDLRCRLYVASKAGKEGSTLTAAEHVVFIELWWSPKDHDQAEDRSYGRTGDLHGATCWYLLAGGTIEEHIAGVYDLKNRMLEKVMDGRDLTEDELLVELLNDYYREAA